MRVLDHERAAWFLLTTGPTYVFDTLVSIGHVQMSLTFELDPSEVNAFESDGRDALTRLSDHVARHGRDFLDRDADARHHAADVRAAIMTWQQNQPY